MNISPTAYPPAHQQMPYGAAFDPNRPNSFPYPPQQQQPQPSPSQYPQPYPTQPGFPPRSQPQFLPQQQQANQSPTPNGRGGGGGGGGPVNQPGAFHNLEGSPYSAPAYTQPITSSSIPSSMPQSVLSSFPGSTNPSQQSISNMAAPPQMMNPNPSTPQQQQKTSIPNGAYPVQNQAQNPTSAQGIAPPLSPKSATREKLRVSLLLEINSHLLQEIISLQQQGKAGLPGQPSPTQDGPSASPTLGADPQSPADPSKSGSSGPRQQPSTECADCMRRLQANLSYLAAVADRHKRPAATFPASPAIMTPPPHLQSVRDLYKKLNMVFPGALQALAKQNAMSQAQSQAQAAAQMRNPGP